MKWPAICLLLALLQNARAPQQPAVIQGIVVDSETGRPLPGSTVRLSNYGIDVVGDSAADGTFLFRNLEPGEYTIEASHTGYISREYGERPNEYSRPAQNLAEGQTLAGIRISLTPGAVIYGRLTDDRGEPVTGATVEALSTRYRDGQRERIRHQSVVSNDLGEYRLFLLPRGEYVVSVTQASALGIRVSAAPLPLYFPGTFDVKESPAIDLHPGETVGGINFASIPSRTRRIQGSVQGNAGDSAAVFLAPLGGKAPIRQSSDPDTGEFAFDNVPPGPYILVARTHTMKGAQSVDLRNTDVLNVRIALGQGNRIPVHVRIEGHGPGDDPALEGLYFSIRRDPPIASLDPDTYAPFADGTFTLDLLAGDYRIDIARNDDMYVKTMTLAGVDVLGQGLRVTNSSNAPLEILVGTNPGSVEGRTSVSDSTVVLIPDGDRRGQQSLFRSATPEVSGAFRFEKVPPGDYRLFASTDENGGPWLDPEYTRKYEGRSLPIRVDAGKRAVLERPLP